MLLAIITILLAQDPLAARPVDEWPVVDEPPDPFCFVDGTHVRTLNDWEKRRKEMKELIMGIEYGNVPPPPGNVGLEEVIESKTRYGGLTHYERIRLTMGPDNKLFMPVKLYVPKNVSGPCPVIIRFGLDDKFAGLMNQRGFAYACFEHQILDPDTEGYDVPGPAQITYPDCDWGGLAVWAWGASRVLDYLETRPDINCEQAIITGHSRTGKAALLTGVLDKRFAMVVPNGSGCGGAAMYRDTAAGAETLKLITLESRWRCWFKKDFARFSDKENRLPFDQHFMRALVAPRLVLSTDGLGDTWANPPGTQTAWAAAQPVFEFLGVPENNLCHFREGGHDQRREDYVVLLDVADWYFRDKKLDVDFSKVPVPDLKPAWSWDAPEPSANE